MPEIKIETNTDDFIKQLRRAGIDTRFAAVDAINSCAAWMAAKYRQALRDNTNMRNANYTLKALKLFPATAKRGNTGEMRKMENINAVLGIPKIGDREHYLFFLEIGATKKGNPKMGGRVAIPLDSSRTGGNRNAPVAPDMRLSKGYHIGGIVDLSKFSGNPRQQYAIMNSMARRGKLTVNTGGGKVSSRAYYRVKYGDKDYLYRVRKGEAKIVRDLTQSSVKIPKEPLFEMSFEGMNAEMMKTYFINAAKRLLADLM